MVQRGVDVSEGNHQKNRAIKEIDRQKCLKWPNQQSGTFLQTWKTAEDRNEVEDDCRFLGG